MSTDPSVPPVTPYPTLNLQVIDDADTEYPTLNEGAVDDEDQVEMEETEGINEEETTASSPDNQGLDTLTWILIIAVIIIDNCG